MYDLKLRILIPNSKFELFKDRGSIPSITFILVLANRKVSPKNQTFPWLSLAKNPAVVIPYVYKYILSIYIHKLWFA